VADDTTVRIVEWPAAPALLQHGFDPQNPLPVTLGFDAGPANVSVSSSGERPLVVAMGLNLAARQPFPVCIRLCEPICVDSDYQIGITLFDRPIITISVKGRTRIYNCGEEL
jgi:hypothetical protein